jgi:5-methylthioadenosine/S-adenosylhomocysteine deaminase
MERLLIRGGLIVTYFYEDFDTVKITEGDVLIEDGFITKIGKLSDPAAQLIDAHGKAILPGFINTHCHLLAASLCKGLVEGHHLYGSLMTPERRIARLVQVALSCLSEEEIQAVLQLAVMECISGGTTTVLAPCPIPACQPLIRVASQTGLRTHVAVTPITDVLVRHQEQKSRDLNESLEVWRQYHHVNPGGIEIWLGHRASDMCDQGVVSAIREACSRLGMRMTLDVGQTAEEQEQFRLTFGMNLIEFLSKEGLLGPNVVLSHCTSMGEERSRLETSEVHVVHCARSAVENRSLIPFYPRYSAIPNVAAGTDYHSPGMLNELRAIGLIGKMNTTGVEWTKATDVFYAATVAGARALGREDIGRVAEGYRADLILVDMKGFRLFPMTFPLMNVVYNGESSDIDTVIINGKMIKQDGKLLGIEEDRIVQHAGDAIEKCWSQARELGVL